MEGECVDAEERPAALAQILDRETEHRGEDQHRIGDHAGMAVRAGIGGVEVVRIEMQGQRREEGALRFGDGAAPMVPEDAPRLEILVAVTLGHRAGTGPEIFCHSYSIYHPRRWPGDAVKPERGPPGPHHDHERTRSG